MKRKNKFLLRVARHIFEKHLNENDSKTHKLKTDSLIRLDHDVSEIMTARVDILAIEISTPYTEVIDIIAKSGFSRIPIYENELDQIKGVLYVKDLFKHMNNDDFNWVEVIREAFFVPESKNIADLLKEFQDTKRHQAIVVDEFGSVVGIVSLEDILEEIVGEINDEFDSLQPSLFSKIDTNTYMFIGKISINDFCKVIGLNDDEVFEDVKGDADTLAGMMIEIAGHLPLRGEIINFDKYSFQIEKADNRKIEKIKLRINE
ncbi:MAG: CBS domain-containing protein [Bacteroidales bacterium]